MLNCLFQINLKTNKPIRPNFMVPGNVYEKLEKSVSKYIVNFLFKIYEIYENGNISENIDCILSHMTNV